MKNSLLLFCAVTTLLACQAESEPEQEITATYYQEAHRPQIHFSPESHWMNDPNGMVYYDGEYHLFYQYYPDSTVWGPMHWGHAVSTDLLHWQHLPIALYPDSLGYIFSGSAVVDWNNTSGLGTPENPPMVAIFTHHLMEGERAGRNDFQYQSIAYSLDHGQSWTKYPGNPVVPNPGIRDFRDPKVSWHEESGQWVMIFAAKDRVRIYNSPNLREWTFASEFGAALGSHAGVWECPDLFLLTNAEDHNRSKWVMLVSINPGGPNGGSATQYFVGDFDGQQFSLDPDFAPFVLPDGEKEQAVWLDYGPDDYAGVTFSDIPADDGRRLFMGWMSNWAYAQVVPTDRWRSAMTLPRVLTLHQNDPGWLVFSNPVSELNSISSGGFEVMQGPSQGEQEITNVIPQQASPLDLQISTRLGAGTTGKFGVKLFNDRGEQVVIGYDPENAQYYIDRTKAGPTAFSENFAGVHQAPRLLAGPEVNLHLIIDRASVELFADGGATVMTSIFFPSEDFNHVALFAEGGELTWLKIQGASLKSVW